MGRGSATTSAKVLYGHVRGQRDGFDPAGLYHIAGFDAAGLIGTQTGQHARAGEYHKYWRWLANNHTQDYPQEVLRYSGYCGAEAALFEGRGYLPRCEALAEVFACQLPDYSADKARCAGINACQRAAQRSLLSDKAECPEFASVAATAVEKSLSDDFLAVVAKDEDTFKNLLGDDYFECLQRNNLTDFSSEFASQRQLWALLFSAMLHESADISPSLINDFLANLQLSGS